MANIGRETDKRISMGNGITERQRDGAHNCVKEQMVRIIRRNPAFCAHCRGFWRD